jgi:hypothetical protein
MADNKVSATLDQATINKIIDLIKEAKGLLPASVSLTQDDRMKGIKMGDGSVNFVLNTFSKSVQHPELVPSFVDINEFGKDVKYDAALRDIEDHVTELANLISDTRMVVGGEAMFAALSVYGFVKQAVKQRIPSAKGVYDELKTRFMFKKHDDVTPLV